MCIGLLILFLIGIGQIYGLANMYNPLIQTIVLVIAVPFAIGGGYFMYLIMNGGGTP
jgi:hypothetical protein